MSNTMQDATAEGLIAFLEWAGAKGVMKAATANAYRAAANKVLEIDDDWTSIDLQTLDVDDQLDRFARKSGSNYTPASLSTYKARFRNAVQMYRSYLDDPAGFKPTLRERSRANTGLTEPSDPEATQTSVTANRDRGPAEARDDNLIVYPFPLRSGATAFLHLPRELPTSEVERLSAFLSSLAIDPPLSLPAASGSSAP